MAPQENAERLNLALRASRTGTWEWDLSRDCVVCDEQALALLGRPSSLISVPSDEFLAWIHPDDRESVLRAAGRDGPIPEHFSVEFRVICPDQSVRHILARGRSFVRELPETKRLLGLCVDVTDQILASQSLRESEARFHDISATIPGFVYRTVMTPNGDHRVDYVTAGVTQTLGWSPEEIQAEGFDPLRLIHPSHVEEARREMLDAARNGVAWNRELRVVTPAGESRMLWVRAVPRPVPDGNTLWSGVALDVTQRARAEQALRASEDRFRAIFENAAAGMALIQPDGRFLRVNPALCEMFGYSSEELLRLTVDEVTHPDDVNLSREFLRRVIEGETEVARFHKRYCAKDGSTVWTRAMVAALGGETGQVEHLVAVVADLTEHARVEQALRESEAVRRSIMESSPDFIALVDRDGVYLFVNKTLPAYDAAQVVGSSIFDIVSPENAEIIASSFQRVIETGRPDRFEVDHPTPDGELFCFETHVGPVVKDGEVTAFILSSRDITQRKRAEKALQESEDRYRSLVELSPDAILLNKNGRIAYANSAGLRLFGASSASELIGKTAFDLVHPDEHPILRERLDKLGKCGRVSRIEETLVRLDGTLLNAEVAGSMIGDNGETTIQVVIRDISERKKAEEALARSEQHFRSLIENSLDVFSILNPDGTSRYQSPSLTRVLGYQPEELNGKDPFNLVHPDDAAMARSRFCEGLRVPGTHQPIQLRMRHRDGSWRAIEVVANNQLDNPAVCGIVVTARDVTERQRALDEKHQLQAQLWQAQKLEALGVLAGGIAHDFNNLLTCVVGFTQLAAEDLPARSSARSHLDEAIEACARARELVQQMLTFGRRGTHRKQVVDIAAEISEALRLVRVTIPKAIEIHDQIDPQCGKVLADSGQLQQVLMNLSTNAYQAMAPGPGNLYVGLHPVAVNAAAAAAVPGLQAGRYVRLTVQDSGPGIDPAIQPRIFEPFFTTKDVGEGSGLGLSVVHGIVANHGGSIQVENVPEDGARISLYFPLHQEAAASRDDGTALQPPGHVLFVDDEESVVRLGRQILERLGYRVTALQHGAKSLDVFRSQPTSFDLVISDISMPGMSGIELAAAIKQIRPDVPVILTTGFNKRDSSENAQRLGVREVLLKPFTAEQLGRTIQGALAGGNHSQIPGADVRQAGAS